MLYSDLKIWLKLDVVKRMSASEFANYVNNLKG